MPNDEHTHAPMRQHVSEADPDGIGPLFSRAPAAREGFKIREVCECGAIRTRHVYGCHEEGWGWRLPS